MVSPLTIRAAAVNSPDVYADLNEVFVPLPLFAKCLSSACSHARLSGLFEPSYEYDAFCCVSCSSGSGCSRTPPPFSLSCGSSWNGLVPLLCLFPPLIKIREQVDILSLLLLDFARGICAALIFPASQWGSGKKFSSSLCVYLYNLSRLYGIYIRVYVAWSDFK